LLRELDFDARQNDIIKHGREEPGLLTVIMDASGEDKVRDE